MKQPIGIWITDTHLSENTLEVNFSVFGQLFDLCEEMGVKTIFHGGDVFTSRKGQPEIVLNAFKNILDIAAEKKLKIISIAGNHDKQNYTSSTSFLDAFDGHPAFTCITPFGFMEMDNLVINFLPYYDEDLSYQDMLKNILESELPLNKKSILLTHVGIDGIKNNGGTKVENGIKQDLFDCFDLVLVGHYHDSQIVGKKKQIVYTGSAYQANFGEDMNKGCTIIFDDCSYEQVPLKSPRYITLDILAVDIDASLVKDVAKIIKEDGNKIRFKVVGELTESQKPLVSSLQEVCKVELVKETYTPIDVMQNEAVAISDIISELELWAEGKQIEDLQYGKKLLMKNV